MIFYDNRYLSSKLAINISRWKRWVREFLPADPLGGHQSGYARQLSLKDGFKVYLAGFLVSKLKFSVPQAQVILSDISYWLKQRGFYNLHIPTKVDRQSDARRYRLYIFDDSQNGFAYSIRGVLPLENDVKIELQKLEKYELTVIGAEKDNLIDGDIAGARMVALTTLYHQFIDAIQDDS